MRVCGYCGWRALCRQLCAVPCFFARFSDWLRSASVSSFRRLHGGGECGRSFRNRRKILRQLRANLIRPDNLTIHHEVLHQPLLRRGGLLEVLLCTFRQREPLVFLGTHEPADPVNRPVFRGNERACSLRSFALGSERGCISTPAAASRVAASTASLLGVSKVAASAAPHAGASESAAF